MTGRLTIKPITYTNSHDLTDDFENSLSHQTRLTIIKQMTSTYSEDVTDGFVHSLLNLFIKHMTCTIKQMALG